MTSPTAKDTQPGEKGLRAHPTTYTLMPEECLAGAPMDTANLYPDRPIQVEWRGGGTWAVTRGASVWRRDDGEWEWEPQPSSRDADFLARTRYSREEALSIAAFLADQSGREEHLSKDCSDG